MKEEVKINLLKKLLKELPSISEDPSEIEQDIMFLYKYNTELIKWENAKEEEVHSIVGQIKSFLDTEKGTQIFIDMIKIRSELIKLEKLFEQKYKKAYSIIQEQETINKYISLEGIKELIYHVNGDSLHYNTITNWQKKGYLGESYSEKELCPNSYTSHRTLYFEKKKAIEFLIKENKLKPKYDILEDVKEGTIMTYIITDDNKLGYVYEDLETGKEGIIC
ncbi:hypothetical protein [Senegalia massiliensis]|uniref:Uncharacterized protein n=1 Tax=Senegalia massiliensis TaxID=1720316 RepID=A0A845R4Y0_9CLOT|nr:hypothetical protein [Senegalia massiliensis]NBI07563.1 hypothetical protein [Senegalia massiliensis]